MPDWASLRAEFPLLDRYVYLNACSLGPLPLAGKAALEAYARAWLEKGTPAWYSDWLPVPNRLRSRVAELLHAPARTTAIAPSVSVALGTLASGLRLPLGCDLERSRLRPACASSRRCGPPSGRSVPGGPPPTTRSRARSRRSGSRAVADGWRHAHRRLASTTAPWWSWSSF